MDITVNQEGKKCEVAIIGRLDTNTAPSLEAKLNEVFDGTEELILDFAKLEYVSSAGLRILLWAQKKMNTCGSMTIRNVDDAVMEVFEITGFTDVLNIE